MARKKKVNNEFPITEYKVEIAFSPEDEAYLARVPELPGCVTHGDTQEEALKMAHEAIEVYLESLVSDGKEIHTPMVRKKFSGNIPLRIDPVLHRDIALKADGEKLSVNKYIEKVLKTA
ncbi:MAG: type II toxin-antitoxin system HicB family antitoxin [Bdellovibrionota bacterium]